MVVYDHRKCVYVGRRLYGCARHWLEARGQRERPGRADFSSVSHLYPKASDAAHSSKAKDLFYRRNSDSIKILLPDLMFL